VTQHSNFPLRAARDTAARGNDTTVHSTSHLAAPHETVAASPGEMLASRLAAFTVPWP
jgi:hypothetical protein